MSHELSTRKDGTVEMAWAGVRPWHGLGTQVTERMTPMNALQHAHLDWPVEKRELWYGDGQASAAVTRVPDHYATVRGDTGAYLGTVGASYTPLQNSEQAEFIEALVGEGAVVETVGALYGGARTFWACKIPGDLMVDGPLKNDRLEQYLTLFNGHDGSMAFRAFWTRIRVVCNNTWRAAASGDGFSSGFSIRHTTNGKARAGQARETLGIVTKAAEAETAALNSLAAMTLTDEEVAKMLARILPLPKDATDLQRTRNAETIATMQGNIETEIQLLRPDNRIKTAWDVFNACTYYGSHQVRTRQTATSGTEGEQRLSTVMLGIGHNMAVNALAVLLDN